MLHAIALSILVCLGGPTPDPFRARQQAYRNSTELAESIIDAVVEHAKEGFSPRLEVTIEEWFEILEAPSHGLPPDIIMSAFRNRFDYFGLVAIEGPFGHEVFDRTLNVMFACHRRARRDLQEIDAKVPEQRPPPPASATRFGGSVVGGRIVGTPPEFRNEEERLEYEAWRAEEARVELLMDRQRQLRARLVAVEQGFSGPARSMYSSANEEMRADLIERLKMESEADGVDYLKLARLPLPEKSAADE